MSTIAYARLTARREQSAPGLSRGEAPPGVGTYVDALAGLVPAEVLALHAAILPATTSSAGNTTTITAPETLAWSFWGLIALSMVIYAVGKKTGDGWQRLDAVRILVPPLAFVGWTMLQRATAFDAVFPQLAEAPRTVSALFLAVLVGLVAGALAMKADKQQPAQ